MKRILFVFGTRPEAIKMAPVVHELKARKNCFKVSVCVTSQHREMLDQVLEIFEIKPDHDLNLMRPNQTLFDVTANAIQGLKGVLEKEMPDMVLVQGDTTTVFAGAMAAYYLKIPVGHIEAGLRTNDKYAPFPEEVNRRLTSVLADYHFAPTSGSCENLLREGVPKSDIYITGNTVIDALMQAVQMVEDKTAEDFDELKGVQLKEKNVLVTGHRRENFGTGFENICHALKQLAIQNKEVCFVYPVHLNPNVRGPVFDTLKGVENIKLIEPLSYLPFVFLMKNAYIVLTDSGGVQEEAPGLGKPVLVMRDTTERPEAVEAGTVKLVGTNSDRIINEMQKLLDKKELYEKMSQAQNPYGDGCAAERIANILSGQPWNVFCGKSNNTIK